jgi:hypothetical protein
LSVGRYRPPAASARPGPRFYVPAIGAVSLLGAWLMSRVPGAPWLTDAVSVAVVSALFGMGVWSFHAMVASQLA